LQDFCERPGDCSGPEAVAKLTRLGSRRAWDLAQRLGSLIRDYEYHRQDAIIQPWLADRYAFESGTKGRERESAQRCIFRHIVREPGGKRARLNRGLGRNFKTLPQYLMELVELGATAPPPRHCVHIFGLTAV